MNASKRTRQKGRSKDMKDTQDVEDEDVPGSAASLVSLRSLMSLRPCFLPLRHGTYKNTSFLRL